MRTKRELGEFILDYTWNKDYFFALYNLETTGAGTLLFK